MMYTFTVRNVLGARKIQLDLNDFPRVRVATTTGFEQRPVSHTITVRDDVSMETLINDAGRWMKGAEPGQACFPYLSPDDLEFLLSGTTPEEWDRLFGQPWEE